MNIFQPPSILLLFVLIRSGDLAISAAIARAVIRAVCYGVVAILALIALILSFGIH
jgi:hypothetical protein